MIIKRRDRLDRESLVTSLSSGPGYKKKKITRVVAARVVAPDSVLSIGQIELNCVLMLNWITWNRTVLTFKQCTYAKMNCLKCNCFCMLNWIVWNRTVLKLKLYLRLTGLFEIETFRHLTVCKQKHYTYTKLNCLKKKCLYVKKKCIWHQITYNGWYCDTVYNIYPKTGVYFSQVWRRGSLVLDPSQNKS